MAQFKEGQRVRVELEGEIVVVHPRADHESSRDSYVIRPVRHLPAGGTFWTYAEHLTLLDPPDWPPQVGDIWEADGEEWFAGQSEPLGFGELVLTAASTRHWLGLGSFKGRNPVLIRRRGQ